MGFWPTWNRYNAATKKRISTAKMHFKRHFSTATVNEFLRCHTNPSNQHYANYKPHEKIYNPNSYWRRKFFNSLISIQ